MARIIDNVIAYRILRMLVTPFNKTDAFSLGIIDTKGKILKQAKDLSTEQEKNSYDYLHRLVFNLKRLINKLPGGESYIKNLVAALFLIKESYQTYHTHDIETRFNKLIETLLEQDMILVEESIIVQRFLEDVAVGAPVNSTSGIANTELPLGKKKKATDYILRRKSNANKLERSINKT